MRPQLARPWVAAAALAIALGGTACSERSDMASDRSDNTTALQGDNAASNRTPITVTGCFQEASGFNNFVLTNTTASNDPAQRAMGYRIERGGDLEQHIGNEVKVTGWIDARENTSGTSGQARDGGDRTSFNDLPELHVEAIQRVSENCASNPGANKR